ncbi:hypothetical protein Cadr_000025192 [Camelus dromedarius]|uniref:Uncharacterized protein n=1 Tax=Camelus dromedarius TaxID=9838 RepID=A0A5N4CLN3_CAMDR|nr:hypothetical protein Cadr_000025192 [Camelus dromedarius]
MPHGGHLWVRVCPLGPNLMVVVPGLRALRLPTGPSPWAEECISTLIPPGRQSSPHASWPLLSATWEHHAPGIRATPLGARSASRERRREKASVFVYRPHSRPAWALPMTWAL